MSKQLGDRGDCGRTTAIASPTGLRAGQSLSLKGQGSPESFQCLSPDLHSSSSLFDAKLIRL